MTKSETIKILYLEDDAADARLLQMMLEQTVPGHFELTRAPRLEEVLKRVKNRGFDLVLSDLDVPDSRGLATFLQIHAAAPDLPIVVLTGLADENVGIQAVQKGAQDYLIKGQANGTLVVRSIHHALERHKRQKEQVNGSRSKRGKVIAFLGAKGGVGTTTVAINVAAALSRQKRDVIAVELRPYLGTFSFQLRRPVPSLPSPHVWGRVGGALNASADTVNKRELRDCLVNTVPGLRVLFGPQKPDEFGDIDPGLAVALIEELAGMSDYTILDLPCQPSEASHAAIRSCSYVVLVTENEPGSVASGKVVLDHLKTWGTSDGGVGAVVVNRVALSAPMKLTDIRAQLGCDLVGVVPPAADALVQAQRQATPLVLSQSQEPAALVLGEIAGRLMLEPVAAAMKLG